MLRIELFVQKQNSTAANLASVACNEKLQTVNFKRLRHNNQSF
jgi:hypothetical protein